MADATTPPPGFTLVSASTLKKGDKCLVHDRGFWMEAVYIGTKRRWPTVSAVQIDRATRTELPHDDPSRWYSVSNVAIKTPEVA